MIITSKKRKKTGEPAGHAATRDMQRHNQLARPSPRPFSWPVREKKEEKEEEEEEEEEEVVVVEVEEEEERRRRGGGWKTHKSHLYSSTDTIVV